MNLLIQEYMQKVSVNEKAAKAVEWSGESSIKVNDESLDLRVTVLKPHHLEVTLNHKTYQVEVREVDTLKKTISFRMNGRKYEVLVQDKYDELLKQLGMERGAGAQAKELKAPMPGKVLSLEVSDGASVAEGDPLLILEAMKMENVIKSPREGVVQSIHVTTNQVVEKNEILISFE